MRERRMNPEMNKLHRCYRDMRRESILPMSMFAFIFITIAKCQDVNPL